jgi:hypothetical protein
LPYLSILLGSTLSVKCSQDGQFQDQTPFQFFRLRCGATASDKIGTSRSLERRYTVRAVKQRLH